MTRRRTQGEQFGFTLVEILVTAVIIAFGLLGLAGLQAKMAATQMEAYQRAHALVLVEDMVARINSQRKAAKSGSYAAAGAMTTVGTGDDILRTVDCALLTPIPTSDLCEWSHALKAEGTIETANPFLGALLGARGCIERLPGVPVSFRVSVAWQGLTETAASSLPCAAVGVTANYGNDSLRRVLALQVTLADL